MFYIITNHNYFYLVCSQLKCKIKKKKKSIENKNLFFYCLDIAKETQFNKNARDANLSTVPPLINPTHTKTTTTKKKTS